MRIVYLLLAGAMLFYALPRLDISSANPLASLFSLIWILFALFAAGGNLTGLMYAPKKHKAKQAQVRRMKVRQRAAAR